MYILDVNKRIRELVKSKRVVDVGFSIQQHQIIHEVASDTLACDICKKNVEEAKKRGFNTVVMDCQYDKLDPKYGKFDVVFAGELIEHLPNPGLFLKNSREWLKEDGIIIITTPNARSLFKFLGDLFGVWNEGWQHVTAHNRSTIKHLLEMNDFEVISIDFFTYMLVFGILIKYLLSK